MRVSYSFSMIIRRISAALNGTYSAKWKLELIPGLFMAQYTLLHVCDLKAAFIFYARFLCVIFSRTFYFLEQQYSIGKTYNFLKLIALRWYKNSSARHILQEWPDSMTPVSFSPTISAAKMTPLRKWAVTKSTALPPRKDSRISSDRFFKMSSCR